MYRRLLTTGVVLSLALTPALAADPTPEELLKEYAESMTNAAKLLDAVKDEKTAKDAKAKLDEFATKQAELKAALEKLSLAAQQRLSAEAFAPVNQAEQKQSLAHDRVFSKEKAAYKVLHGSKLFDAIEKPREKLAATNAGRLGSAAKAYMVKNRGNPPVALKSLVVKENGRLPLVDGGEKSLIDPWGAPYQYQVVTDEYGNPNPHVWTVSPYSGKKLGNPPPEKK
jgi:hypothetical protein